MNHTISRVESSTRSISFISFSEYSLHYLVQLWWLVNYEVNVFPTSFTQPINSNKIKLFIPTNYKSKTWSTLENNLKSKKSFAKLLRKRWAQCNFFFLLKKLSYITQTSFENWIQSLEIPMHTCWAHDFTTWRYIAKDSKWRELKMGRQNGED